MTLKEKEALHSQGFSADQISEIEEGINAGLDTSVYADKEFFAIQMRQIRLGLEEGLPVEKYATTDYDWFQMEEIRKGLKDGIDVSVYASPEVPYDTMHQIRKGLIDGIDLSKCKSMEAGILREFRKAIASKVDIIKYIKEGYVTEQLKEIRLALEKDLDIEPYLEKEFRGAAISEIAEGLAMGLNVAIYAKIEFGWQQMREIRLGLEGRIDVDSYSNVLYSWQQMREIRLGLEAGLDVSSYKSLMYTANDMRRKRLALMQPDGGTGSIHAEDTVQANIPNFVITMSADEMEAYVLYGSGEKLNRREIVRALDAGGIRYGIIPETIEALLTMTYMEKPILIAQGSKAKDGEDGWYEYFFKTDEEHAPKLLEDGSVDYQNTEWFSMVKEGQKIAYYHEAGKGTDGCTVNGRAIPARKGREKNMLSGSGFILLPDRKTYIAMYDGMVSTAEGRLDVTKLLVLDEVTIATGRVDFEGSIYVRGNVGSGTSIKALEDIIVDGFVESANIESGASIILRQGVNASGNGTIKAEKNVVGRFFESARVYAGGDILANYCMNSELHADGFIVISGESGTLVGGTAYAAQGIEAHDVGNRVGLPTVLKIGINEKITRGKQAIKDKMDEVAKELSILRNAYADFHAKYPPEVRNTMDIYLKVESAIFIKDKEMSELEFANFELDNRLKMMEEIKAVVHGRIYDGVVVDMNEIRWRAKSVQNVTLRKVNGKISVFEN